MAWITNNSELNPKLSFLPDTENYTEGSIVVLSLSIGDIEYILNSGLEWVPNRALTDINVFISNGGMDDMSRGDVDNPIKTLQFFLNNLPRKIKNINIYLNDISSLDNHNGFGLFTDFEMIDPNNYIHIHGRTTMATEVMTGVIETSTIFNGMLYKISVDDALEYSAYLKINNSITGFGTDTDTGWQYIERTSYSFIEEGFYVGQVVYNDFNNAYSYVTKVEDLKGGTGRLYLLNTIFTAIGQFFSGLIPEEKAQFIRCENSITTEKIGQVWPVLSIGYDFFIVPVSPYWKIVTGDQTRCARLTKGTFVFDKVEHQIYIDKVMSSIFTNAAETYSTPSMFRNCSNLISISQSNINSMSFIDSPNAVFNRCRCVDYWKFYNSFNNKPMFFTNRDENEKAYVFNKDIVDLAHYDSTGPIINGEIGIDSSQFINSGILFISSITLGLLSAELYKSAVSFENSIIHCANTSIDSDLITLDDSYLQIDDSNMVAQRYSNFLQDPSVLVLIGPNSKLDIPNSLTNLYDVDIFYKFTNNQGGVYRSVSCRTYDDRAEMLSDNNIHDGSIGCVVTEPGNMYLRQRAWVVISGNKYTTDNMPTPDKFIMPDGLEIFNLTLGREVTWWNPTDSE